MHVLCFIHAFKQEKNAEQAAVSEHEDDKIKEHNISTSNIAFSLILIMLISHVLSSLITRTLRLICPCARHINVLQGRAMCLVG